MNGEGFAFFRWFTWNYGPWVDVLSRRDVRRYVNDRWAALQWRSLQQSRPVTQFGLRRVPL